MPVAPGSRLAKRARVKPDVEADDEGPGVSASHVVSFLTGLDDHNGGDEDEEDDEGEGDGDGDGEDGSDASPVEDADEDASATPTKRAKQGLVGKSTPRSTPTKQRKTPTPRKAELVVAPGDQDGVGIIRPSKSDAYFLSTSRSARTSGNSYSALVKPLSQAQYEKYASSARSKGKSRAILSELQDRLAMRFPQWQMELEEGFNLIFYGFGSKRRLLNRFVTERLSKSGHCVVINGHFPQMSIREIFSRIEDTLSIPQDIPVPLSATTPLDRAVHRIYSYFLPPSALPTGKRKSQPSATAPLFIIIHKIDSPALRTPRSLSILSLLASSPRIRLIASFDHLHTPLLFSLSLTMSAPHAYAPESWTGTPPPSRGFNWIYHNATTYDDYDLELTYQRLSATSSSLGITSTSDGGISEEGALQILRSVPPMALRLLKLLLLKQLSALPPQPSSHTAHPGAPTAPIFAVDNDILQTLSREKFIAREEERYNALMGEFKDHGLVVEAGMDGEGRTGRWIWVPLGKATIERVLETMGEVEV